MQFFKLWTCATRNKQLHDCDKIGYFNDKFDVDENRWDMRWGNVVHVAKVGLLKAFNANDVKDEVVWEASFKIQSIDTNSWVLSTQKVMQSLQKYKTMQGGNAIIAKTNNQARELMPLMGYCGQRPQFG